MANEVHAETFDDLKGQLDAETPGLSTVAEALREAMDRERAISIAPMITELADEVLALRCKYQNGDRIDHAVGEVRNALESLEDAMERNREARR